MGPLLPVTPLRVLTSLVCSDAAGGQLSCRVKTKCRISTPRGSFYCSTAVSPAAFWLRRFWSCGPLLSCQAPASEPSGVDHARMSSVPAGARADGRKESAPGGRSALRPRSSPGGPSAKPNVSAGGRPRVAGARRGRIGRGLLAVRKCAVGVWAPPPHLARRRSAGAASTSRTCVSSSPRVCTTDHTNNTPSENHLKNQFYQYIVIRPR